jgi:hypothetical protein
MLSEQYLEEPVADQLMERPQFLVSLKHGIRVFHVHNTPSRFKRPCRLFDDGIGDGLAGNLPERDEAINRSRKTYLETP